MLIQSIPLRKKLLLIPHKNNILLMDKVRKRIRTVRLDKEYTQDYIGDRLGMSQKSYHRLENGKYHLKLETLLRLDVILEVDVTSFLK